MDNRNGVSLNNRHLKKREMSLWSVAFIIFTMTAAGAFGIEAMVSSCGPGMTIAALAILPVIWVIPICLMISELTVLMPAESGIYVWTREAFGEFWGFSMGWWGAASGFVGLASIVVLAVDYLGKIVSLTPTSSLIIKVAIVVIFTIVNLLGVKEVGILSTIFSALVLIAFAVVTVVGFTHWEFNPVVPFMPQGNSALDSVGMAIAVGIWMYCGYAGITNIAGEMSNPQIIPKAFKLIIPIIAVSYILPTIAGIASVGNWEMWGTEGFDFSTTLTQNIGPVAGILFLLVAVIATCSQVNVSMMACSRAFFVLGDDNLCPKFLTKLSANRKVPYWPLLILAAVTMILMNLNFSTLLIITAPLGLVTYILMAFVFVKMRRKYPVEERGDRYYIKGGKPVEFILVAFPLLTGIAGLFVNGTEYFIVGFLSIATSVIFYYIFKRTCGGMALKDPKSYPLNEKTKMSKGDLVRIGTYFIVFGALLLAGGFFLNWYEGAWGPEYYKAMYGSGFMSNFALMIRTAKIGGIAMIVIGIIVDLIGKKVDPIVESEKRDIDTYCG